MDELTRFKIKALLKSFSIDGLDEETFETIASHSLEEVYARLVFLEEARII